MSRTRKRVIVAAVVLVLGVIGYAFIMSPDPDLKITLTRLDTNGQGNAIASVLVSNGSPHTVYFRTLGQVWGPTLGLPTTTATSCKIEFPGRGPHTARLAAFTRHDSNWLGRTRDYMQRFFRPDQPDPITFYSLEIPE